jgi:hypothetical protein
MNALSSLGRYFQPQGVAPQVLAQGLTGGGQQRGSLQFPTAQDSNTVALSDAGKALAQQSVGDASSMLQRASDFASATIDAAKTFVSNFAESLFGDAAKGMTLSFDTSSISASSSFASALQHSEGSNGTSDSAALRFEDASDFVGTGTITTADGHRFSFEVEVHYESTLEMSASSSSSNAPRSAGIAGDSLWGHGNAPIEHRQRPTAQREGLAAHFPGSVSELFKMFDQGALDLPFQGPAKGNDDKAPDLGKLTLRLLDLFSSADAMAGKLARTYGDFPSSSQLAEQV